MKNQFKDQTKANAFQNSISLLLNTTASIQTENGSYQHKFIIFKSKRTSEGWNTGKHIRQNFTQKHTEREQIGKKPCRQKGSTIYSCLTHRIHRQYLVQPPNFNLKRRCHIHGFKRKSLKLCLKELARQFSN